MGVCVSGVKDALEELRERQYHNAEKGWALKAVSSVLGSGKSRAIDPGRLRNSWNVHHEVPYHWRESSLCTANATFSDETRGRHISPEALRQKVQSCLTAKAFRTKPPQASAKQYVKWMLKRIDMLTRTGGPRMRVVWWRTLVDLGRIPRWPEDKHHILDLRSILVEWLKRCDGQGRMDGRYLYVWMLSHRWERPHFCDNCLKGNCELSALAHPDSMTNIKARVIGKWGEAQYDDGNVGPLSPEDYYVWIDFTSIDQEDSVQKLLGIEMLPLYVACCGSGLILYLPNDDGIGYEERAWTAIERVLAYTYGVSPVLKKIDSGFVKGASRWNDLKLVQTKPNFWELNSDGKLCFRLTDPLDGFLTCKEDIPKVEHLKSIVSTTPPIDFYDSKEPLIFNTTLCRVDDTCRERSTVMHRGYRRTTTDFASPKDGKGDQNDGTRKYSTASRASARPTATSFGGAGSSSLSSTSLGKGLSSHALEYPEAPRSLSSSLSRVLSRGLCCCRRRKRDANAEQSHIPRRQTVQTVTTAQPAGFMSEASGLAPLGTCLEEDESGEESNGTPWRPMQKQGDFYPTDVAANGNGYEGEGGDTFGCNILPGVKGPPSTAKKNSVVNKRRMVSFSESPGKRAINFNFQVDGGGKLKIENNGVDAMTKRSSGTMFGGGKDNNLNQKTGDSPQVSFGEDTRPESKDEEGVRVRCKSPDQRESHAEGYVESPDCSLRSVEVEPGADRGKEAKSTPNLSDLPLSEVHPLPGCTEEP